MTAPSDESSSGSHTFWRKVAAFVAAMIPLAAAINGWFALQLEKEKFASELQLKYVDRALDTSKDPTYRESFLRFLMQTTSQTDLLHKWARDQLQYASEIGRLRNEIAKVNTILQATAKQLALERSRNVAEVSRHEQAIRNRLAIALTERGTFEAQLRVAELKVGYPPPKKEEKTAPPKIFRAEFGPYAANGFVEPGYFSTEIRISGENFGQSPGRLYEVLNPEKTTSNGPPLKIIQWNDTEIRAEYPNSLPANWQGSPRMFIGLTTADLRFSEPAELLPDRAL